MSVEWSDDALADWRRLGLDDAAIVAGAVQRFHDGGESVVIHVEGEFRLFVGAYVVSFLVDGDTLHVDRVRRA